VSEEEISRFSRRQSPFGLQHSDGGQLPMTAEAAFGAPIIPAAMILVESTGGQRRGAKAMAVRQ
jgi:hypothetical protein